MENRPLITKHSLLRSVTPLAVFALVVSACSTPAGSTAPSTAASQAAPTAAGSEAAPSASAAAGVDMAALEAAAKAEGNLTTIALPHSWCNYGELLTGFNAKYGIAINELNPDGGSGDEIEAIKANKDNPGPAAPDVIDVGLSFGPTAKTDGLIQAYKVSTWDSIPETAKDADGFWYGDYYGVLSFEVNTKVVKNVPADWPDLLKPEYKNQVALAGDPTVSNQAISGVWASGFSTGGSLDNAQPGLDFFKQLNAAGNFVPVIAKTGTVASGDTPIRIAWTYNALADKDSLAGNPPIEVVVPTSGRFGGMYVQAISAYAPHPNAAKLWMEYLYSDEGQAGWLKGYCHTTRLDDLKARKVSSDLIAKLPDITGAVYPTSAQAAKAKELITKQWDTVVGANVK
jgi:putative spermidine/putrescine transport system substrate-binding protein